MATRRMNSRSVLFLNHEIQELLLKYVDKRYLYQFTNTAKNDLKTPQIAKFMQFLLRCVIFVAMATSRMNSQSVLFLNHEMQELLFKYDDERYCIYISLQKLQKVDLKTPKIPQLCNFSSGVCYLLPWQLGL